MTEAEEESAWKTLTAGISYAREHTAVGLLILSMAFLVFFGFPYVIILTAVDPAATARDQTWPGSTRSSTRSTARARSSARSAVAGLPPTIKRHRIIPLMMLAFAVLIIAFSLASTLPVMIVTTTLAGAAYMGTSSLVMTSIQSAVPGYLRGRVMALFMMAFLGVMPLSAFVFGPLGQWIGPDTAVLLGGVILLAWAVSLALRPSSLEAGRRPRLPRRCKPVRAGAPGPSRGMR